MEQRWEFQFSQYFSHHLQLLLQCFRGSTQRSCWKTFKNLWSIVFNCCSNAFGNLLKRSCWKNFKNLWSRLHGLQQSGPLCEIGKNGWVTPKIQEMAIWLLCHIKIFGGLQLLGNMREQKLLAKRVRYP